MRNTNFEDQSTWRVPHIELLLWCIKQSLSRTYDHGKKNEMEMERKGEFNEALLTPNNKNGHVVVLN